MPRAFRDSIDDYLELSYQTFHLPAWAGNPSVRLIKAPKLTWFDSGVQRALSGEIGARRASWPSNSSPAPG